jgi:hypothetical protein
MGGPECLKHTRDGAHQHRSFAIGMGVAQRVAHVSRDRHRLTADIEDHVANLDLSAANLGLNGGSASDPQIAALNG